MAFSKLKLVAWAFPKYNSPQNTENCMLSLISSICPSDPLPAWSLPWETGLWGLLQASSWFSQSEAPAGQQKARDLWGQSLSCFSSSLPATQITCVCLSKASSCHRVLFIQLSQQVHESLSPLALLALPTALYIVLSWNSAQLPSLSVVSLSCQDPGTYSELLGLTFIFLSWRLLSRLKIGVCEWRMR